MDPRPRIRGPSIIARTGDRLCGVLTAGPRLSDRSHPLHGRILDDDLRKSNPRFSDRNFGRNLASADQLRDISASVGASPAQVALAWLLAKGPDIVPIPGTKHVSRLEENLAADTVELTADHVTRLDEIPPAAGEHHSAEQLKWLDR